MHQRQRLVHVLELLHGISQKGKDRRRNVGEPQFGDDVYKVDRVLEVRGQQSQLLLALPELFLHLLSFGDVDEALQQLGRPFEWNVVTVFITGARLRSLWISVRSEHSSV